MTAVTKSKMWLQLLAFWHNITIYALNIWSQGKQYLRTALGPAPQQFYLLADGRVLPSSIALPESVQNTTYVYDPTSLRISAVRDQDPTARYRRLPLIAASFQHTTTGDVDISDWLGEIRAHPVPEIPVKQLLTLWSLTQNTYAPISDGVQVTVTSNDGETTLLTFD